MPEIWPKSFLIEELHVWGASMRSFIVVTFLLASPSLLSVENVYVQSSKSIPGFLSSDLYQKAVSEVTVRSLQSMSENSWKLKDSRFFKERSSAPTSNKYKVQK